IKTVIIPKTVKKIGKEAFSGCKKLRTLTIKTTKLKKKTIGKNAVKNINKKAKVKVPKSKKKAYRKILKKKGLPKTAKIK
nr:leucine-rich repeat domain-containing protein [Eubacterium sp.]